MAPFGMIPLMLRWLIPTNGPRWATLFLTRKCNLRCSYCYVPLHDSKDIPLSEWKAIIDRLADHGVILATLVGGEPTARKDLEDIIAHMRRRRIYSLLHSNLTLLDETRIRRLADSGLFLLTASLDSLGGFEKSSADMVFEKLQLARSLGVVPVISSVLTSKNAEELPEIARAAVSRGVFFNFGLYQHVGGLFSIRDERLIPPQATLRAVFDSLLQVRRRSGGIRSSKNFLSTKTLGRYQSGWKCNPDLDRWLVVNNDGTLMRCQEYASPYRLLDIDSLGDRRWIDYKRTVVDRCPGCSYHCYMDAEERAGPAGLAECSTALRAFWFGRR